MVSRSTRPSAPASTRPPAVPGLDPARSQVVFSAGPAVDQGDLRPSTGTTPRRAVIADPCASVSTPLRILGPTPHGALGTVAKVGQRAPQPTDQVACIDDARCICPLSGHVSDAERAVMDDLCGQAARLATALRWALALTALVVLIALMR